MNLQGAMTYVSGDYGPSPSTIANIFFRVLLNFGAAVSCWVPLRLFHKNGELAGASMAIAMSLLNFFYAANALLWPTNDIANWTKGYGWCDLQLILWVPLETLNAAAVCAVMQNIANQVSLLRASGLTSDEKRRKSFVQAVIILPVPALQVILYYFVIAMRYNISGIIGCQAVFDPDWVFLVFFVLPCPMFAIAAAYFAVLTWIRYRKIDAVSRKALLCAGNGDYQARAARTRRKLYLMALTIVVPYCPMQMIFLFNNIRLGLPWTKTYNLGQLHSHGWDQLDYAPSTSVSFTSMYINYIAVLEVIVFFIYFGRTKDAHEMYRKYLRALGLGSFFPSLSEEWRPSARSSTTLKTLWSRAKNISSSIAHTRSSSNSTNKTRRSLTKHHLNRHDDSQIFDIRLRSLDLEAARMELDVLPASNASQLPDRNPRLSGAAFKLPKVPIPAFFARKRHIIDATPNQSTLQSMVALLGTHHFATDGGDDSSDLAKANVSRETVPISPWSSEDLSVTKAGLRTLKSSTTALHSDMVPSEISRVEQESSAFLTAAYVPKPGIAGCHGFCDCEEDSSTMAGQRARQQADFEHGLISIKRDFARK